MFNLHFHSYRENLNSVENPTSSTVLKNKKKPTKKIFFLQNEIKIKNFELCMPITVSFFFFFFCFIEKKTLQISLINKS